MDFNFKLIIHLTKLFLKCRDAGDADLDIHVINEDTKTEVPIKLTDNGDRTFTVDYEPKQSGLHSAILQYGGLKVPSTPIHFKVNPNVDVSKIKVDGLEESKYYKRIYTVRFIPLISL